MQISRLKLSGFKSFVEPAELRVEPGLTGVVGPNGCGKSNLLEAIRWVMGESSPKSMRSGGMEDVIFAGTQTRPPRDFAEVVLQGKDDDGEELVVTRRIERGAGSAYRLNGVDVRAKDVALTFADAATGAHSPALVSQGKIAQVIAAKPAERRQMLEEAAGIAGLHVRRKDAELKLRQTERNLARLEDIMAGLDNQILSLRRQAKQAERYKTLSDQIKIAEARLLYGRWHDAAAAADKARAQAQSSQQNVLSAQIAADAAQKEQKLAAIAISQAREELTDRRDDASAHGHRMTALTNQLEAAGQRLADLDRQKARLAEDRRSADRLANDAADALTQLEKGIIASTAAMDADEARRPALLAKSEDSERASRTAELALAKATADQAGIEAEWRVVEAEINQANNRLARLNADTARYDAMRHEMNEADDPQIALDKATLKADEAAKRADTLRNALAQGQIRKTQLQVIRDEAASALANANAELAGIEREHKALARDRDARAHQLKQREGLPSALEKLRVRKGFERAVAAVLGRDAKSPLGTPPKQDDGRFWTGGKPPMRIKDSILSHIADYPPELEARLALVHYTESDDQRDLAPGEWLVTKDGHLRRWDGFIARGEGAAEAAKLEAANRLEELENVLPELRATAERCDNAQENARVELTALQTDLVGQERGIAQANDDERMALRALDTAQAAKERLADRIEEINQSKDDLTKQVEQAQKELITAQAKQSELPPPDAGRASLQASQAKNEAARMTLQASAAELAAHDQALAVARERNSAQKSEKSNWEARSSEAAKRMAETAIRSEEIEQERAVIAAQPEGLIKQIEQGDTVREKLSTELSLAETAVAEKQAEADDADTQFSQTNEALSRAREVRAGLAAQADNQEARRRELAQTCGDRFQCPPPMLCEQYEFTPEEIKDVGHEASEMERLTTSRDRIGPVNLVAAEELSRIEGEYGESAGEQQELAEAVSRLRGSIGSLNREGRERLRTAFEEVDGHFRVLFARLFQGGQAHLALVDSDDPLEAGLEIYAQPPGKRLQSLSLLSGGEQALTATALIFALFLTNPAPICVLDEVDAPLDDANIERFCDLLNSMVEATATRYLIVTHNAVTMSRMHRLFGVTMAEKGVSRLVSVDLGQAEMLVAE